MTTTDPYEVCEVVITAPDAEWLTEFARHLVVDRLAAAAHTIAEIHSTYWWRGKLNDKPEARLALHTRRSLVPAIIKRTNRDHPYEVPCVVATDISGGNPMYIEWILDETADPQAFA